MQNFQESTLKHSRHVRLTISYSSSCAAWNTYMTGTLAALLGHRDEAQLLGTWEHGLEGVCVLRTP